jgi:hypothetical protein
MTLVRSSFSVSRTMCKRACITGRMKGVIYSLARKEEKHDRRALSDNQLYHLDSRRTLTINVIQQRKRLHIHLWCVSESDSGEIASYLSPGCL